MQFVKIKAHYSGTNRSPYEAKIGCKAEMSSKIFLAALGILSQITNEDDHVSILIC